MKISAIIKELVDELYFYGDGEVEYISVGDYISLGDDAFSIKIKR